MNYYFLSIIIGFIGVIIFNIYNIYNKNLIKKNNYIKFFIYTVIISISSIFIYLNINNLPFDGIRNQLPILNGEPNF